MATKKVAEVITIEEIKKQVMKVTLEGTSDLVLCKKTRSYVREEIFKQSHPKGTKIPDELKQPYNLYEKLITSIHWENEPPEYDDYSEYTQEMWEDLVKNNRPCILSKAFTEVFASTFRTFYKESTGRAGTDFKKSLNIAGWKNPVDITSASFDQHLTPTQSVSHTNVLAQHAIFSGWSCTLTISFVPSVIPEKTILELINNSGSFVGVGSRTSDGFGRFRIKEVAKMK